MPEIDTVNLSQHCTGINLSQFVPFCLYRINTSIATKNI